MAAMIDTERRGLLRKLGSGLVVRNVVSWRTIRGYDKPWRGKLRSNWSPEQIAGWLKRAYPADEFHRVSHETIYRSLFVQARGVLKKELLGHLRWRSGAIRRSKRAGLNGDRRGQNQGYRLNQGAAGSG